MSHLAFYIAARDHPGYLPYVSDGTMFVILFDLDRIAATRPFPWAPARDILL